MDCVTNQCNTKANRVRGILASNSWHLNTIGPTLQFAKVIFVLTSFDALFDAIYAMLLTAH